MSKCTICLPVFNGEANLDKWFEAILGQTTGFEYDILIVDSGSKDRSVGIIKKWQKQSRIKVSLIEIPNIEFSHGHTRNFMVDHSNSEILVFTVQDALPLNNSWLKRLDDAFEVDPKIGAVFGRHIANLNAHPISMRYIDKTFEQYRKNVESLASAVSKNGVIYYNNPSEIKNWDKFLAFSNVNAAYRREVIKKIRFAEIDFAEDRQFVKDAIKDGYFVGYVPDAVVYHSHDFNLKFTFKKTFDEWKAIKESGGYQHKFRPYHIFTQSLIGYGADLRYILFSERLAIWQKVAGIATSPFRQLTIKTAMYFGLNFEILPESLLRIFSEQATRRKVVT
ncbi:glycosyltransferase [Candidatus Dojkabacteria bacterium]|uniref:Glycosyltransferase n=1 Tax=Candidatus Dojkabacteria bacterium TaxID=2099670 RepID=A0A955HX95_9BACT|nr:glycosyltransferase [Candidatus Dojkabacteria bacterium]